MNPASPEAHAKYVKKKDFNFDLLADSDRTAAQSFNALKDDGKGILRTVYIIDKSGKIAFAERGMPADDTLLEVIKNL